MERKPPLTLTEEVRARLSAFSPSEPVSNADTYQFCYFIRKTEQHSVVIKVQILIMTTGLSFITRCIYSQETFMLFLNKNRSEICQHPENLH